MDWGKKKPWHPIAQQGMTCVNFYCIVAQCGTQAVTCEKQIVAFPGWVDQIFTMFVVFVCIFTKSLLSCGKIQKAPLIERVSLGKNVEKTSFPGTGMAGRPRHGGESHSPEPSVTATQLSSPSSCVHLHPAPPWSWQVWPGRRERDGGRPPVRWGRSQKAQSTPRIRWGRRASRGSVWLSSQPEGMKRNRKRRTHQVCFPEEVGGILATLEQYKSKQMDKLFKM